MILSKSDYMLFLRHPAWLWLKKFDKAKLPPVDEALQARFDEGYEFESYAEQLFPQATKLGFNNYDEYLELPAKTQTALENGVKAILQGRFEVEGLTCIVDVLERVEKNVFSLIEIKASTKAKPEHLYDLAFQVLVLEKAGLQINSISVLHANKDYVRQGEIEPEKFVSRTEVINKVRDLIDLTQEQIKQAQAVLQQSTMPDISLRFVNQIRVPGVTSQWLGEWLEIYETLQPNLDKYSIYHLSYPSPEQLGELEDRGIKLITDVPEDLALRPKQLFQIKTTKTNQRIIDRDKIKDFLSSFEYPLYFFDYETFSSIVPKFDGCQPYKDYPFQYSLHILKEPNGELEHKEYLHNENSNPMPDLLKQLQQDIGETGTVLTWNMSYEKGCNDRMAKLYPEYADFLASLNNRIEDLMTPFSEMWFFDKDFFGSASVKKVLPVLVPELSYKEMVVGDGLTARRMWTETVLENKHQDQRTEIMNDLSKYCTLDTYAMVRILEELLLI